MKKGLLFLLFILTMHLSYGQALTGHKTHTQTEINNINTNFLAAEGDMYQVNPSPTTPATATKIWYIGLSDGSLQLISNKVKNNGNGTFSFVNELGLLVTFTPEASGTTYNNGTSGLTATNVKAALDEIVANIASSNTEIDQKTIIGTGSTTDKYRVNLDNNTLEYNTTNGVQVKDGGITNTQLANDAVLSVNIKDANVTTVKIADDAIDKTKINPDVAGTGLKQNIDGSLEVDPTALTADGDITSTDITVTGGVDAALNDVTLTIADDAIDKTKINPDVAGTGLKQNIDGSLEVDPTALTADGDITSTDITVTGGVDAALNDVTLTIADDVITTAELAINAVETENIKDANVTTVKIADDAIDKTKINPDVAGTGLKQNIDGSLEVDPTALTADGDITSTDITVTGGVDAALNDVTLTIADDVITTAELANDAVETANIKDANVTTVKIADDAIDKTKINPDVAGTGLKQNIDGSLEVDPTALTADGDITSTDITVTGGVDAALNDVTLTIADDVITTAELANDAVETANIKDANVTTVKIADDAIDKTKINPDVAGTGLKQNADGSLEVDPTALTADGDITSTDITVTGGVDAALNDVTLTIADDVITTAELANDAVETANIKDANVTTVKIADDAIDKTKINPDVAGTGLKQNIDGSLEVDPTALTADGDITSTDITVTGGVDAALNDVTLTIADDVITTAELANDAVETANIKDANVTTVKIADDAIDKTKINPDVAGTGLKQNADGSLEVDPTALTADGDITSTDITVTGGVDAALNDVTLTIADDAIDKTKINPDVAGTGLKQNIDGSLEVDPTALTADGDITSTDITVTGGVDAALNDVTLTIADDVITTAELANDAVETANIKDANVTTVKIADDAIDKTKINPDVAGTGLKQNADGSLEVDPTALTADGDITSTDITVTGGVDAALNDVTLTIADDVITTAELANDAVETENIKDANVTTVKIADDAIDKTKINPDVAGTGLKQNIDGSLEVDPTALTADGDITSTDITVTGGVDAALNDVTLTIADDVITTAELAINAVETENIKDANVTTVKIADDAIDKTKINPDVAGTGLKQNIDGSLEVDPTALTADGDITSTDITVTGGVDAALNDVTLTIADDAIDKTKINPDVAGTGLKQNIDGSLEVDPTALTADGDITSTDITVTGGVDAALNDVTLTIADDVITTAELANDAVETANIKDANVTTVKIADDAIDKTKINPDVAGTGLKQNADGSLEVDPTALTADGDITSTDITVTGGVDAALNDVTLTIADDVITTAELAINAVETENIKDANVTTVKIADDAIDKTKINPDVAGTGLKQNIDGSLEVDPTALTADGDITSTDITVTGGVDAALNDVTLTIADDVITTAELANDAVETANIKDANVTTVKIADDAIDKTKINPDVAGTGLKQNIDGSLEVDPTALTADGDITSTDITVTGGVDAALNDVTLTIADDVITTAELANDAVETANIKDANVTTVKIADDAIDKTKINPDVAGTGLKQNIDGSLEVDPTTLTADGDITSTDITVTGGVDAALNDVTLTIADDVITTAELANDAVETENIKDANVTTVKIADDAIDKTKINPDVAGTGLKQNIDGSLEVDPTALTADGDITSTDITVTGGVDAALNDVTLTIADDVITTAELANDAVETANIKDANVTTVKIADDAIDKTKINPDVAGTGLKQNIDGSLEVDPTTLTADGDITSTDITVTGGVDAALNDVTLTIADDVITTAELANDAVETANIKDANVTTVKIADDAIDKTKINPDVAGTGLKQNIDGSLEVDPTTLTADGDITSTDITVTGGVDAALNDVTLTIADDVITTAELANDAVETANIKDANVTTVKIADDAIDKTKINPDVAGTGLKQNIDGSLEVDPTTLTADGDITSTDITVTGGVDAALNDVTLTIADDVITTAELANDAVETANIKDANVTTVKIADDAIDKTKINPDVAGTGLKQNIDGSLEVDPTTLTADGDITSTDITVTGGVDAALNDVTLTIADDVITTAELANDAVETANIKDGEVKTSDIADNNVTLAKIANGTANGQLMQWNGTNWILVAPSTLTVTETQILSTDNTAGNIKITGQSAITINVDDSDANATNEIQTVASADGSVTVTPTGINYDLKVTAADGSETILANGNATTVAGAGTTASNYKVDVNVDNATIEIAATKLQVKADGILTGHIAAGAVENSDLALDAVTTSKIKDATILAKDINQNSATAGQVLAWDPTLLAGTGNWVATTVFTSSVAEIYDAAANTTTITGDGTSDVETTGVIITFGNIEPISDVSASGYTLTSNSISPKVAGNYKVTYRVTLTISDNSNNRTGSEYILLKGGAVVPGTYSSNYHRNRYINRTTATMTKIMALNAGDVLTVRGYRYSGAANLTTKQNGSSLLIEKI